MSRIASSQPAESPSLERERQMREYKVSYDGCAYGFRPGDAAGVRSACDRQIPPVRGGRLFPVATIFPQRRPLELDRLA